MSCLRQARELDEREARAELREPWANITYNLAAALARAGDLDGSLDELARVVHLDENWKAVEKDRDFDVLREHADYVGRLRNLLERARTRELA